MYKIKKQKTLKKQLEYIKDQINKIRNSVDDKQSQLEWQRVNEVSGKNSNLRTNLKAKKKVFRSRKNISRICFETLLKSQVNLLKKLLISI